MKKESNKKFSKRKRTNPRSLLLDLLLNLGFQVLKVPRKSGPLRAIPMDPQAEDGEILRSTVAMQTLVENFEFKRLLDIGSGAGRHADFFRRAGKEVTELDYGKSVYFEKKTTDRIVVFGDYMLKEFDEQFDCIWASHVLEHQLNVNAFLKKCHSDLREGGVLCITVPPARHELVGGHLTLWNGGLVLYNLILAGFNCNDASVLYSDYNISVIVKKVSIVELPELSFDSGDIDRLSNFFPDQFHEGASGFIRKLNWP